MKTSAWETRARACTRGWVDHTESHGDRRGLFRPASADAAIHCLHTPRGLTRQRLLKDVATDCPRTRECLFLLPTRQSWRKSNYHGRLLLGGPQESAWESASYTYWRRGWYVSTSCDKRNNTEGSFAGAWIGFAAISASETRFHEYVSASRTLNPQTRPLLANLHLSTWFSGAPKAPTRDRASTHDPSVQPSPALQAFPKKLAGIVPPCARRDALAHGPSTSRAYENMGCAMLWGGGGEAL